MGSAWRQSPEEQACSDLFHLCSRAATLVKRGQCRVDVSAGPEYPRIEFVFDPSRPSIEENGEPRVLLQSGHVLLAPQQTMTMANYLSSRNGGAPGIQYVCAAAKAIRKAFRLQG